MGVQPNVPIKVSIDTMLDFDSDFDGHGHADVSCKQTSRTFSHSAFRYSFSISQNQWAQNASRVKFTPIYKRNKSKERGCNCRHGHLYENNGLFPLPDSDSDSDSDTDSCTMQDMGKASESESESVET